MNYSFNGRQFLAINMFMWCAGLALYRPAFGIAGILVSNNPMFVSDTRIACKGTAPGSVGGNVIKPRSISLRNRPVAAEVLLLLQIGMRKDVRITY